MPIHILRLIVPLLFLFVTLNVHAQYWLYSVRPGDTLWDLCNEYTVVRDCWMTIGDENGVEYPRRIPPGTIIKFPIDWLKTAPEAATVNFVRGDVTYRLSAAAQILIAQVGTSLPIGSTLFVGIDSSATIAFANESVLVLEENSELELNMLATGGPAGVADSHLRLLRGATSIKVPQQESGIRFEIETPAAVAAVRGTEFRVVNAINPEQDDAEPLMRTEVLEGSVDVGNSVDQQLVQAGFGVVASSNQPVPAPVQLLPAPVFNNYPASQVSNVSISWNAIAGAERYRVNLFSDDGDEAGLLNTVEITDVGYTWQNLPEACYRITISGIDSQSMQGLPGTAQVCSVAPIARVNIIEDSFEKVASNQLQLSWTALEDAGEYELEVSYDENFQTLKEVIRTSDVMATVNVTESREHFFRVSAVNQQGVRSEPSAVVVWSPTQWDKFVAAIATVLVALALF